MFGCTGSMLIFSLVSKGNLLIAAGLVSVSSPSELLPSLTIPKAIFIVGEFGM